MKGTRHNSFEIIDKFRNKHGDKFDYSLINYINIHTKIKIICPEHGIFKQTPLSHLRSNGCKKCSYQNLSSNNINFIKKSKKIHENKYDYSLVSYTNAHTKVDIKCNKCNNIFKQTPNKHLSNRGCPSCLNSKGENKIKEILNNNNIFFIEQKTFDGCKYKRKLKFDFYIPDYNICVEYDGEQHFEKYRFEKNDDRLNIRKIRDYIKSNYCKKNNINLIRIKYDDNMELKINEKIIKIHENIIV